jgi:hypothetical protein
MYQTKDRPLRPRFVTVREACDYLRCGHSHFYGEVFRKVKTAKLGKRTLIDLASLDELADSLPAAE